MNRSRLHLPPVYLINHGYGSNRAYLWDAMKSNLLRLSAFLVLLLFCASGTVYAVVEDTGVQNNQ